MPVARLVLVSTMAMALSGLAAFAQSQIPSTDVAPGHPDPYARDPYITSSGATVPNPGKSQSGGPTPQERAIQRQDNKIDKGICKGC